MFLHQVFKKSKLKQHKISYKWPSKSVFPNQEYKIILDVKKYSIVFLDIMVEEKLF